MRKTTLGVVIGNRGFFPAHLCEEGRKQILKVLEEEGFDVVVLPDTNSPGGSVESLAEAKACGDLFRANRDRIDGILITLPNFGDERANANSVRFAGLDVPVLVHAFNDDSKRMTIADRRDSFCGKMSTCNNLRQYGIKFSLTTLHTVNPDNESFRSDLRKFGATCRTVRALRKARLGAIGARPTAFKTVRYSEKLLEQSGISVDTLDLSEVLGWANKLNSSDSAVKEKLDRIREYTDTKGIPDESLDKMARLGVAIDTWATDQEIDATAIQCWTALEEFYGVVPCTLMSMMSNSLMASACETDVAGVVGMYALQCASGMPSALLDWNNNYGTDPDKAVVFHCSNLPKSVFNEQKMDYQEIIAGTVGKENTYGTIVGRMRASSFTYCRISTDDYNGRIVAYVGEGELTNDLLNTFGGYGVVKVPELQKLLRYICENGFEHHVAFNLSESAEAVNEAFSKYMGWDTYWHAG
ncbi:MAG: fucose isomerase [Armatimonadetes bacterium 55-13]|nr:L-fucose/L-arabinose isomerase family protein [Armatimonadota bacterium]ODU53709.1 MAG: fucose isomerase [bacterium SCN 57-13]OJU61726.1 MAG: fucose isomerase [Armatimonadetes bacterium 55-13]